MKLEYLKEFLILAQVGNYTAAAEEIYVSESTLSRHIMSLEKELRTTLFHRTAKGVTLSDAGTLLMPHAQRVIDTLDEYDRVLEEERLAQRRLTVGFGQAVMQYGIAEHLFRFRREHPDIDFVMAEDHSEHLCRLARSGESDFIFCYINPGFDATGLKVTPLLTDTLAVALPEYHPLAGQERLCMEQLKNEHFIMPSRNSAMSKLCFRLMKEAGCDVKKTTFAGTVNLDMVSQGMGVALLEKHRYLSEAPENVRFVDLEPRMEKRLVMAYRDRVLSPQAQIFLSFIQEHLL